MSSSLPEWLYEDNNPQWHNVMDDIFDDAWEPGWDDIDPEPNPLENMLCDDEGFPYLCLRDPDLAAKLAVYEARLLTWGGVIHGDTEDSYRG